MSRRPYLYLLLAQLTCDFLVSDVWLISISIWLQAAYVSSARRGIVALGGVAILCGNNDLVANGISSKRRNM